MRVRPLSLGIVLIMLVSTITAAYMQAAPPASVFGTTNTNRTEEPASATPTEVMPTSTIALAPISNYQTGIVDESVAEIVTYDPVSQTLFATNAFSNTIDVFDLSNPGAFAKTNEIDLSPYGDEVNSADFYSYGSATEDGLLAVAVASDPEQDPGIVVFFDREGTFVGEATVGALPDMVTFTPDGRSVLVANEGEPNDDYTVDPEGSISIISGFVSQQLFLPIVGQNAADGAVVRAQPDDVTTTQIITPTVREASFTDFNDAIDSLREDGVRIFGPNATVAQDLEPEYIAVSPNSQKAYVTLQENNALAIVDISSATVEAVLPLGAKDHSVAENAFDASNEDDVEDRDDQIATGAADVDGTINIRTWPVLGLYQPDAIAAYQANGQVYLVTANEGDAREYEGTPGYVEETRIGDESYVLDPTAYANAATLKENANLGRLLTTTASGDTDGDGDFDQIYSFGARSFTIWNASTGAVVFDSGNQFEEITAAFDPSTFNSQGDDDSFDSRSDDKGPEPESVVIGEIDGSTYAFIGLERVGGIMVYDITDPANPTFVQYVNSRYVYDDISPEGLKFIPADQSPSGNPLLVAAFEVSGSITVFEISTTPDGAGRLTLLHNNDGESQIFPTTNRVEPDTGFPNSEDVFLQVAGIDAFKAVLDRNIAEARQAGNAVVNVYAGDAFLASAALQCTFPIDDPTIPVYDAVAQRQMNYDAHILGNHEFDYTPDFLERFIRDFQINGVLNQPFLSANLDFSGEAGFADLTDADGLIESYSIAGEVVAASSISIDEVTGQRFGIVSAVTPGLPTVSSPRDVVVTTPDIAAAATVIQQEVDRLQERGLQKIILVSHLQNLNTDLDDLIPQLRGVDIAVGGGGDEALFNEDIDGSVPINTAQRLPGEDDLDGNYPATTTDADGRTVYVVTTEGNYKYAGRLDVVFDANGEVAEVVQETSYPRRVIPDTDENADAIAALGITDAVIPDATLTDGVVADVQACLDEFAIIEVATTEVVLDVSRDGVRGEETNAGNLITDAYLYVYGKYASENELPGPDNRTIAIQNGGGIRQNAGDELPVGGSAPGPITFQNTLDVLAFTTNSITIIEDVPPEDVKAIFERAASGLPDAEGRFLQIAGVNVTYDVSQTAQVIENDGTVTAPGQRVIEVTLEDGTQIITGGAIAMDAPNITIVTNSFTAGGGDNYPWLGNNANQTDLRNAEGFFISYDSAWREYMQDPSADGGLEGTVPAADYPEGGEGRITINNP